eukprot:3831373-Rhodomonas_salina.2
MLPRLLQHRKGCEVSFESTQYNSACSQPARALKYAIQQRLLLGFIVTLCDSLKMMVLYYACRVNRWDQLPRQFVGCEVGLRFRILSHFRADCCANDLQIKTKIRRCRNLPTL